MKGYSSPNADRREAALARKRQEYMDCVPQYYDIPDSDRTEDEIVMLRQVLPAFALLRLSIVYLLGSKFWMLKIFNVESIFKYHSSSMLYDKI